MPDLKTIFEKIDSLREQLEKLKPFKREDEERLWKKFRLEWNYNSNHIEGNTLTYGQTELLIIFEKTTGDHDMREYEEMKAHDVAMRMVTDYAKDSSREITEADIREINKIILVRPFWNNAQTPDGQPTRKLITPGEYKKEPNSVLFQNGEMFHYASPEDTPAMMKELLGWYSDAVKQKKLHPVEIAALIHYKFVRIHPFDDSNGRTSRLLMNYVLLRFGYPPVIIKSADKKNYLNALNKADVGDVNAFVEYVGEQLVWSLEIAILVAKHKSIEEKDDIDKEISIWKRGKVINEGISKSPILIISAFNNGLIDLLQDHVNKINHNFSNVFDKSTVEVVISINGGRQKRREITAVELKTVLSNEYIYELNLAIADDKYTGVKLLEYANSIDSLLVKNKLAGYKMSNEKRLSVFWNIEIEFNKFDYLIKGSANFSVKKKYSQAVSEQERQEIVNKSLKELFLHIKAQESH